MKLRCSPQRNTFQRDNYIERQTAAGKLDDPETIQHIEYYNSLSIKKSEKEADPNWQKNSLEYELRTSDYFCERVKDNDYAKKLYAALCNTDWVRINCGPITKDDTWGCSWRYAGGIIADMREEGDYIDWYCSGDEGVIDPEIEEDLLRIGWKGLEIVLDE